MCSNGYNFTNHNLIEKPEKYQRFPFMGIDFLKEYEKNRQRIINEEMKKISKRIDDYKDLRINELEREKNDINSISTYSALCEIFHNILFEQEIIDSFILLKKFLVKFELKRRIHSTYTIDFKEEDDDFKDLKNYLILSLNNLLIYEKSNNLKYLNTSLKINDVICSCLENFQLEENLRVVLIFVLEKEIHHVHELCQKLEVGDYEDRYNSNI